MVVMRSTDPSPENDEIWGTWEELLLACAVNRHGIHTWDSVAAEVRSRSANAHLLTVDNCRQRYLHLSRRFAGDEINGADDIVYAEPTAEIPWLDELRKLRVAELRQQVQRYDVSIGSLELKVKKLEEERERSLQETEAVNGSGSGSGSDPKGTEDQRMGPQNAADSGRSCKESNSTEPKVEEVVKLEERVKEETDRVGNRSGSDPVAGAEASYNGSSETIARGAVRSPADEANPVLNESGESVAESKGGEEEEGTKESSDVQSSASLSRRRRKGRRRRAGDEPEVEAVSTVRKSIDVESQPLIAFLEIIRSNKNGSVFGRRLESQESARYRSLIRRHVDFEMVRNRVGRNGYGSTEFFRDLLLLCNNALVFYPSNSPESISAVHLRHLINKEIAATLRKTPQTSPPSPKESTPPPPPLQPPVPPPAQPPLPPPSSKSKSDPDPVNPPHDKPSPLPPLVACRKRSSIMSKPSKKVEKVKEEKVEAKHKEKEEEVEEEEEEEVEAVVKEKAKVVDKKSTKQRSTMSRGLRTNKTRSGSGGVGGGNKGGGSKNSKPDPVEEEEPKSPPPTNAISTAKKKGAANFLNRIKKSSPNGTLLETLKGGPSSSSSKEGKKRAAAAKEGSKRESSAASAKRNVGRPPKRAAAPAPASGKRAREEKAAPLARKRGRR